VLQAEDEQIGGDLLETPRWIDGGVCRDGQAGGPPFASGR